MPIRVSGVSGPDTARKALLPIWTVRGFAPAQSQGPGDGSRSCNDPAASLGDGDLPLIDEARPVGDQRQNRAVKCDPGDDCADDAVPGKDVYRALRDSGRRRAGAPAGQEQHVRVRLAQPLQLSVVARLERPLHAMGRRQLHRVQLRVLDDPRVIARRGPE